MIHLRINEHVFTVLHIWCSCAIEKCPPSPSGQTCARWAHLSKSAPRYSETSKALIQSVGSEFPQLPTGFSNHISRRIPSDYARNPTKKLESQSTGSKKQIVSVWSAEETHHFWLQGLLRKLLGNPLHQWWNVLMNLGQTVVLMEEISVKLLRWIRTQQYLNDVIFRYIYLPRPTLSISDLSEFPPRNRKYCTPCCGWVILAKVASSFYRWKRFKNCQPNEISE